MVELIVVLSLSLTLYSRACVCVVIVRGYACGEKVWIG